MKQDQFYVPRKIGSQTAIYNFLHTKHGIAIDVIIDCIEEYDKKHVNQPSSNRDFKRLSTDKGKLERKLFLLGCITYSDPWADNFGKFLTIVSEKTGIKFKPNRKINYSKY